LFEVRHEARAKHEAAAATIGRVTDESCIDPAIGGKCRTRAWDEVVAELAAGQHGVVARRQLLAAGLGRRRIEIRLDGGRFHPIHHGVYAVGHRALTVEGRWMASVLACGANAVLSHRSAAQLWRLIPRSPQRPEVTRQASFRPRPGIDCHQSRIPADEIEDLRGIPVTSPPRTLLDLATVLPRRGLERALHEAEVRRLTGRLSLPDLLARYPRRRGTADLRALLSADRPFGVTQNDFEELFVAFLDDHGLPRPQLNGTLPIRGRLLRPDCMWPSQRLLVELDGRAVHGTRRTFESDRQRDRILLVDGWRSTRVTWRQLHDEPAAIAGDLRDLLRSGARTPTL
jgi:very-short-patch-repair endonuclease